MKLFHTSPTEIKEINTSGRFGEFIFFSTNIYTTTAGEAVTYSIEIDEDCIIEAGRIFYHEESEKLNSLVSELAEEIGCDEETAESLIEESADIFDIADNLGIEAEDIADAAWNIQHYTARAAQILGFRGVAVRDEQGTAFLIAMAGKENELTKE